MVADLEAQSSTARAQLSLSNIRKRTVCAGGIVQI